MYDIFRLQRQVENQRLNVVCIDVRKKRPPKRLSQRPNDIYVNRKSDFASQLARSHKLLDQG